MPGAVAADVTVGDGGPGAPGAQAAEAGATSPAQAAASSPAPQPPWRACLRYGGMGLPLAFVALPLYVLLPQHHAERYGLPLAALGALLLAVRALDALWDPWLGRVADALLARGRRHALGAMAAAAALLLAGFVAVFFPPASVATDHLRLLAWSGVALAGTFFAYSLASVLHQAWAARIGGGDLAQSRLVSGREGAALAGVMLASALPLLAGWPATTAALVALLGFGWLGLARGPAPGPSAAPATAASHASPPAVARDAAPRPGESVWRPWASRPFRRLLAVYLLNGIANAIPATLLLFFVRDVLRAPDWAPGLLAAYFAAGALSLPLWVRAIARIGLERAWGAGMAMAVAAFSAAAWLGAGDVRWFLLVCIGSGLALGADLAAPPSLLARTVAGSGDARRSEGLYFGWWTSATKLNLALAAGFALPLLQLAGYSPGVREPAALTALALSYAVLPCLLKLAALAALTRLARTEHDLSHPSAVNRR